MSDRSPPLLTIDSSHHGAWVVIAGGTGLALTLVSLLIRVYVRIAISPPFATDDILLSVASVFTFIQSTVVFSAVDKGYGTHINLLDRDVLVEIQRMVYAGDMLYLIALYLIKCSVGNIFLRLSPKKGHKLATWATFGLCTVWVVAAMFMISINCLLRTPWEMLGAKCSSLFLRWQVIGAIDIITEGCLFGLAIYLLAGLQMPQSKKWAVLATFAARLPLIAFSIIRLSHLDTGLRSTNPPLDMVLSSCWTQAGLNYSIVACTSFCLKPFMSAANTNYGNAGATSAYHSRYGYGYYASKKKGGDSVLDRISGSHARSEFERIRNSRAEDILDTFELTGMGGKGEKCSENQSTNDHRTSVGSSDSTKMIIRKDVTYTIEYEARETSSQRS